MQSLNTDVPIVSKFFESLTSDNFLQPLNASKQISSTLSGISTLIRLEQFLNVSVLITINLSFSGKITVPIPLHSANAELPILSTLSGIVTPVRFLQP